MKQAIALILLTIALLEGGGRVFGTEMVTEVAHGAISVMALLIAGTFLWLWFERSTPLALGMCLSWLGVCALSARWWAVGLAQAPLSSPGLLALPMVGALLHFAVIERSFGRRGIGFLWPVVGAVGLSVAVRFLT